MQSKFTKLVLALVLGVFLLILPESGHAVQKKAVVKNKPVSGATTTGAKPAAKPSPTTSSKPAASAMPAVNSNATGTATGTADEEFINDVIDQMGPGIVNIPTPKPAVNINAISGTSTSGKPASTSPVKTTALNPGAKSSGPKLKVRLPNRIGTVKSKAKVVSALSKEFVSVVPLGNTNTFLVTNSADETYHIRTGASVGSNARGVLNHVRNILKLVVQQSSRTGYTIGQTYLDGLDSEQQTIVDGYIDEQVAGGAVDESTFNDIANDFLSVMLDAFLNQMENLQVDMATENFAVGFLGFVNNGGSDGVSIYMSYDVDIANGEYSGFTGDLTPEDEWDFYADQDWDNDGINDFDDPVVNDDIDNDGISNGSDDDMDGDGAPNENDPTPQGNESPGAEDDANEDNEDEEGGGSNDDDKDSNADDDGIIRAGEPEGDRRCAHLRCRDNVSELMDFMDAVMQQIGDQMKNIIHQYRNNQIDLQNLQNSLQGLFNSVNFTPPAASGAPASGSITVQQPGNINTVNTNVLLPNGNVTNPQAPVNVNTNNLQQNIRSNMRQNVNTPVSPPR